MFGGEIIISYIIYILYIIYIQEDFWKEQRKPVVFWHKQDEGLN